MGGVLPDDPRVDAVEYHLHLLVALGRVAELVAIDEQVLFVVELARALDLFDDLFGSARQVERDHLRLAVAGAGRDAPC